MHGAAMVNVHLADLWARNKRAWQSICKVSTLPTCHHVIELLARRSPRGSLGVNCMRRRVTAVCLICVLG